MLPYIIVIIVVAVFAALFTFLLHGWIFPDEISAIACTADAKVCADGSAVGRTGPDCSFVCPEDSFLACIAIGNPAMKSYPRQCRWENGTTVTEVLAANPDMLQSDQLYVCESDADCVVKNIGNCCGMFLACVNQDYTPDLDAVSAACEREGRSSVCGFQEPAGCVCVNRRCKEA